MYDDEPFETLCRVLNKAIESQRDDTAEIELTSAEMDELVSALAHYRKVVDPHSGDVVLSTEYTCPVCGNTAEFRAHDEQVSTEATNSSIGVEVVRIHGIAECPNCLTQTLLTQFEGVKIDGYDESAWNELYTEAYQHREQAERI